MNKQKVLMISILVLGLLMAALSLSAQEYSIQLNGTSQGANCGSSPDFNFSNALTVEAWIYPTDFKAEEHMNTIVAKTMWSTEYSHGWTFRYGSANRSLNFNMGGGEGVNWIDCKADEVLTLNTWQHVAATYDGTNIKIYVNGTRVATQAFAGGITNADNDLCIGYINHADMRYMTGKIDEVRIWNVVRTVEEISDNVHHSVTSPDLVAYYKMDGGSGTVLTDDSGNGHTADLIDSPTWVSELPREFSLQLNGNGQYATCGSESDFLFTNQLTIEAWIYPTDFKEAMHMNTIVAKTYWNPYSYGWAFRYGSSNGTLNFNISSGGTNWIDCIANDVLTLNTWQHVAVTYNGTVILLYVNGDLVGVKSFNFDVLDANSLLSIGSINKSDDMRYMTGQIDEVRIWNVARSASDIYDNMGQCEISNNLLAYYRMTNGSGNILSDNSGHGHTGTLVGSPIWDNTNPYFIPMVSTENTTSIGPYSANANGTLIWLGINNPIQHGHCWITGTSGLPTVDNNRIQLGEASSPGAFSSSITGLSPNTLYRVRAYATCYIGNVTRTSYGELVEFTTSPSPPPIPTAYPATLITNSGFTANWYGWPWYKEDIGAYGTYYLYIDVSTDNDFSSFVGGYHNRGCGNHNTTRGRAYSLNVTGLASGTTYYYRVRSAYQSYSPYSDTIPVTTLATYNVTYNTGSITGVRIYTAETDFGIDPPSPLVFTEGYCGTILAEKEGYIWSLAEGSDSNVITNLSSDKSISFVGTYRFIDPANPDIVFLGEADVPLSAAIASLEDLAVPPSGDPGEATILMFSGSVASDITINISSGTWYASAYYDDPLNGGVAWHHANPYPAVYPQNIIFSNLPFAAKSNIPVVVSSQDTTLPVELSSFTATVMGSNSVDLRWVTQSETNLRGFRVLRNTSNLLNAASNICNLIPATNSSHATEYIFQDMDLISQDCYYYWLEMLDLDGTSKYHGPISVMIGNPGASEPPVIPLQTRLLPSYPNPFNPTTTIAYELKSPENVSFKIYSTKGQLVATHNQAHGSAGRYAWIFTGVDKDGRALASGVYICVMSCGKDTYINKIVLAK